MLPASSPCSGTERSMLSIKQRAIIGPPLALNSTTHFPRSRRHPAPLPCASHGYAPAEAYTVTPIRAFTDAAAASVSGWRGKVTACGVAAA